MKHKTLQQLIKLRKFNWVNSGITKENFPEQKNDFREGEVKLFSFDKTMLSEDVIKEMDKEGYSPCTIRELLSWDGWNGKDFIVGLGSLWRRPGGGRRIPVLGRDGVGRTLCLGWFGGGWAGVDRFAALCKCPSDTLSLESRIKTS